jgi:tetratricopeptide (TPR) repeat protein/predicted Ser/Thr protein kinase
VDPIRTPRERVVITGSFESAVTERWRGTADIDLARGWGHPLGEPPGARRLLARLERDVLRLACDTRVAGRYTLLEQIGAGGLGVVYAAYDAELDRRVALKFLRLQDDSGDRGRGRLLREARAMAKLSHPHVVTVYDVGSVDDEVFIAMELVDGVPLSTWLRARTRTWQQVRGVLLQAGQGLAAAHEVGLVHRDLKPQNVLVGSDGRARVLDFGLARTTGTPLDSGDPAPPAGSHDGDRITASGAIAGTPAYMAPEQFLAGPVGTEADQFSFCVTLFEGLFGHRPFHGPDLGSLTQAIAQGTLVTPRTPHDVPAWLQRAVLRGLEADPAARYPSMHALLAALGRDRRARRKRILAAALGGMLVVAATVPAAVWLTSIPSPEEAAAVEQLANAAREAAADRRYLVPPADHPAAATAYAYLRRLEQVDGAAATMAAERAASLRTEFATALVSLGDEYWDVAGGKAYAADYYAWALVFEVDNDRARSRALLTRGELREILARAESSSFDAIDLRTADVLSVLADTEAATPGVRLDRLRTRGRPRSPKPESTVVLPRPDEAVEETPRLEAVVSSPQTRADPPRRAARADPPPDRPKARELAALGRQALAAGRDSGAGALLHQALEIDRRQPRALAGMARLHFDAGANNEALRFVKLAVRASPRDAGLRILCGDIHMRVLEYDAARAAYTAAARLGHRRAEGRLRLLDQELGR